MSVTTSTDRIPNIDEWRTIAIVRNEYRWTCPVAGCGAEHVLHSFNAGRDYDLDENACFNIPDELRCDRCGGLFWVDYAGIEFQEGEA